MTATQAHRTVAGLFVATLLMLSLTAGAGGRRPGIAEMKLTPRTDAGNWYGTWAYKSRDQRILLWIQEGESGKPDYRLQYQDLSSPEAFTTDWSGRSDYAVTGNDAVFHLTADKRDATTISGTLNWDLQFKSSGRKNAGQFEMYRGGDGRILVLSLFEQVLTRTRGEKEAVDETPFAWTFVKVSKRLVLWEEVF